MKKIHPLFCMLVFLFASCATDVSFRESQGRYLDPTVSTNVTPMAADLNVSAQRITFEVDYSKNKNQSMNVSKAKSFAIAAALAKYKADVLVAPLVNVTEDNNNIHVMVSGYPATYINFRKASIQDFEMQQAMSQKRKRK